MPGCCSSRARRRSSVSEPEGSKVSPLQGRSAAVEASYGVGGDRSVTRAELRAIAADLRGYCAMVGRSAQERSLDEPDDALARFAGKLADLLAAIVESIERRLS